ncbi:MAG: 3'-5' exonuclease [Bacteroidota bacterium]
MIVNNYIVLDLETTGLSFEDEILEIAIIDEKGKTLLQTLVRPTRHKTWVSAQRVHGISPKMVEDQPILDELLPKIKSIIQGREVVIYNADYDCMYLPIIEWTSNVHCCMISFASHMSSEKWWELSEAARYVLWEKPKGEKLHRATTDCLATLAVWQYLHDPKVRDQVKQKKEADRLGKEVKYTLWEYETIKERELLRQSANFFIQWLSQNNYHQPQQIKHDKAKFYQEWINYTYNGLNSIANAILTSTKYETLILFKKRNYPTTYKSLQHLKRLFQQASKQFDEKQFTPIGLYTNNSYENPKAWLLYDARNIEKIIAAADYHVSGYEQRKAMGFYTATELMKMGIPKEQWKCVGSGQNRLSFSEYWIYEIVSDKKGVEQ